ncbi:fimbrial protein [Bordetella bronchiseptica]|nr:fimbrial protein [Bordetella bronchiseptica]AUL15388.1 protein fimA [Bordetella bronchiseptica]AWP58488.1 protein fimA [Bordetella bronchiseptica]AWQ05223.1 protein fimA [Bordetella bronchiseptica]AZW30787.1 protein fimA [Bordetella bronchiseptica]QET72262.1 fimbrial protein [Bordetella bronchiseptica]
MNLKFAGIALGLTACALTYQHQVFAADGTLVITGAITDTTCKINGAEPPTNIAVQLPTISRTALKDVGSTAGGTVFDVKLTECPQALNGQQVGLFFEPGGTVDYTSGNLFAYRANSQGVEQVPQTKADNVQFQLANLDGSAIHLGRNKGAQAAQTFLVSQTAGSSTYGATLRYLARYIRSGAGSIVAGNLRSQVGFSVMYP